jgi:transposase
MPAKIIEEAKAVQTEQHNDGVYFRSLLLGYFEGIDSERGIAWRLADSLSMRKSIAYALTEETPDHSTISRTRRLYSVETHIAVFRWVLKILVEEGLVEGKTVSIDDTHWRPTRHCNHWYSHVN